MEYFKENLLTPSAEFLEKDLWEHFFLLFGRMYKHIIQAHPLECKGNKKIMPKESSYETSGF